MEDNKFDDLIRKKVEGFEGPDFDPNALSNLHQRLDGVVNTPWYAHLSSQIYYASGLLAVVLLISLGQYFLYQNEKDILVEQVDDLNRKLNYVDSLEKQIVALSNRPADTIRIIELRSLPSSIYLESIDQNRPDKESYNFKEGSSDGAELQYLLGDVDELPYDIVVWLEHQGVILKEGDKVYLSQIPPLSYARSDQLEPFVLEATTPLFASTAAPTPTIAEAKMKSSDQLDTKTVILLDKHYHKGVGLNVAPFGEINQPSFGFGAADITIASGLLVDAIMSPALSVETGFIYSGSNFSTEQHFDRMVLEDLDPNLGDLERVEVDTRFIELPLNLKYRLPLSATSRLLVGVGVSATWYTRQEIEFTYQLLNENGSLDERGSIRSNGDHEDWQYYPGNINLMLGITEQLRNNKILEASLYYRMGLGKKGVEQLNPNTLGIRAAYWFNIR